jgi:hypothetical protein
MSDLPWLRLYTDIIDNEKIRMLAFEDRWHFTAILCCKQQGILDQEFLIERKLSVKLGVQLRDLDEIKRRLIEVGLIDDNYQPIGWDKHQFKSDSSKIRTKKYRENQHITNKTVTRPSQQRNSDGTETETETYKKKKENNKEKTSLSSFHDDVIFVANYLESKIMTLHPKSKRNTDSWLKDIDKAIRLDGRTKTELITIIDWIYTDGTFWQSNILSGKKLRDQYDHMIIQKINGKPQYKTSEEKRHERDIESNRSLWSTDF